MSPALALLAALAVAFPASSAHGLVVDGVCGPLTCRALGLPS